MEGFVLFFAALREYASLNEFPTSAHFGSTPTECMAGLEQFYHDYSALDSSPPFETLAEADAVAVWGEGDPVVKALLHAKRAVMDWMVKGDPGHPLVSVNLKYAMDALEKAKGG